MILTSGDEVFNLAGQGVFFKRGAGFDFRGRRDLTSRGRGSYLHGDGDLIFTGTGVLSSRGRWSYLHGNGVLLCRGRVFKRDVAGCVNNRARCHRTHEGRGTYDYTLAFSSITVSYIDARHQGRIIRRSM